MASVDQLLAAFAEELRNTGEADPQGYLRQVEGADRRELAALIEGHLERAGRRTWEPAAFKGSFAERVYDELAERLEPETEPLTALLVRLRNSKPVTRGELTKQLAVELDAKGKERKVARYYHQLEQGLLSPQGVSPRVFEALGSILGASAERLRAAGAGISAGPDDGQASPAFARQAMPASLDYAARSPASPGTAPAEEDWDEVDRLFRGDG
jgi:hypothetical protein